jgi:hypothetical protein
MKRQTLLFTLLLFSCTSFSQQSFVLKLPDAEKINKRYNENESITDVVYFYLNKNYNSNSAKYAIQTDADFDNIECGYTKKFKYGILFITNNCGEASPLIQKITFPKTNRSTLQKWVELIYKASLPSDSKPTNNWKNQNEYTPNEGEVGCYYKIIETSTKSIVEIWCGC